MAAIVYVHTHACVQYKLHVCATIATTKQKLLPAPCTFIPLLMHAYKPNNVYTTHTNKISGTQNSDRERLGACSFHLLQT